MKATPLFDEAAVMTALENNLASIPTLCDW